MKVKVLILMTFLILALTACKSASVSNVENPKSETVSITIGIMPDATSVPFVVAKEKGYFEKEGLLVELIVFKSALDRDAALQANEINATSSDLLSLLLFAQNEVKYKALGQADGRYALAFGAMNDISQITEKDKVTVGLSTNTLMEYLFDKFLTKQGIDKNKIEKVSVPQIPARLELLANGQLDMATLPEPLASSGVEKFSLILPLIEEENEKPSILIIDTDIASTDVVESFISAYNMTVDYLNNTDEEVFLISEGVQTLGFPANFEKFQFKPFSYLIPVSKKEFYSVQDWLLQKEMIKIKFDSEDLCL